MPGPTDTAARMAAAAALFAAAGDGSDERDPGPAEEPWWLDEEDDPLADPLAGLDEDQVRQVLDGPQPVGAGFTRRAEAAGRSGAGFGAGGPLDVMEPGGVLARLADDAYTAGLARLCDDELMGFAAASRRLQSRYAATELAAVGELDRRRAGGKPASSRAGEHVSDELAAALALTGRSADGLLGLAKGLARLPGVLAALLAGRIDLARARVFADELAQLGDATANDIAAQVIGGAGSVTTARLRALLRRLVMLADADALRRRAEAARRDARVECFAEASGNGALAGRELPRAEVIAASARVTAIAAALKDAGAPGSIDELRAQVFLALLGGRDPAALAPRPSPCPAADGPLAGLSGSVNLVMPVTAWLGQSEAPGEVAGHGPVDAGTCRDLASWLAAAGRAARWCVSQVGPDGRVTAHACAHAPPRPGARAVWLASLRFTTLETGTCAHPRRSTGYRPPGGLAHLIRVRQRTCSFPGCRRPSLRCDLDHTKPWDQGGLTCECNLSPLCRRHHRAKQAPGWRLEQPAPGALIWTPPHGRTYVTTPSDYPV